MRARAGPAEARRALETLCRIYRPPVLAYIRARGHPVVVAEDLAQAFFMRFLEEAWHANADPARGRFRAYLLTAVKRYVIDAEISAHAAKRGGAAQIESIDEETSELNSREPTPEEAFDRAWALAVLRKALAQLDDEARKAGKGRLFETVREFLVESPDESEYARAAERLGMRPNTIAVAVHRLRRRLRELVQFELQETTSSPEDYQRESSELGSALGSVQGAPKANAT